MTPRKDAPSAGALLAALTVLTAVAASQGGISEGNLPRGDKAVLEELQGAGSKKGQGKRLSLGKRGGKGKCGKVRKMETRSKRDHSKISKK